MRHFLLPVVLSVICGVACAADAITPLTVQSADKKSAITLQLSEGWKTFQNNDGSVSIEVPRSGVHVQVWALSHASIDEAEKQAGELIKSQAFLPGLLASIQKAKH